ncbi:hypothetical protein FHQ22_12620 [Pasteurellaceae bacterium Phil31]|nr:hypothetical protein FHQ22_12620 [Pasteurellaceae bacterium Phil31]
MESLKLLANPFILLSFLLTCFIIMRLSVSFGGYYLKNNMGHLIGVLLISMFILIIFAMSAPNLIYITILQAVMIIFLIVKNKK